MALTYEAIATVTVGSGGAANIEFTSIPGTYTDLALFLSGRSTDNSAQTSTGYNFNGSTSGYTSRNLGNYQGTVFSGSMTTLSIGGVTYGRLDDSGLVAATATASTFSNGWLYVPNYAGSDNKSWSWDSVAENNSTAAAEILVAGLWSNTAAITSIKILPYLGNFAQYSTATLYGIKNTV